MLLSRASWVVPVHGTTANINAAPRALRNEMESDNERPGQGVLRDPDLAASSNVRDARFLLRGEEYPS